VAKRSKSAESCCNVFRIKMGAKDHLGFKQYANASGPIVGVHVTINKGECRISQEAQ
jgi:hypothetical protein